MGVVHLNGAPLGLGEAIAAVDVVEVLLLEPLVVRTVILDQNLVAPVEQSPRAIASPCSS